MQVQSQEQKKNAELLSLLHQLLGPNTIETKEELRGRESNVLIGITFKPGALLEGYPTMKNECSRAINEGCTGWARNLMREHKTDLDVNLRACGYFGIGLSCWS